MRKSNFLIVRFPKKVLLVLCIFFIAFTIRLLYIMTAALHYIPVFDAGLYDAIARNLVDKNCYCIHGDYSTVSRAPLWPWIMSIIYYFADKQVVFAQLFYCLLGSGTCVIIYLLSEELFTKNIALLAGLIAASYAGLFIYDGWVYTESLYTFCLTGLVYTLFMLQRFWQRESAKKDEAHKTRKSKLILNKWVICSGLLLAAATLTRPNGSGLLGVIYLWAGIIIVTRIVKRELWLPFLQQIIATTLLAFLLILPWSYRNYTITHQFVLVATGMGEVLVGTYNDKVLLQPPAKQGFWSPPKGTKIHDDINYTPSDDKNSTDQAITWITSHIDKIPVLFALHFENMWKPYTYSHGLPIEEFPQRFSARVIFLLIPLQSIPIFVLALLDCILTWRQRKKDFILIYIVIAFTVLENVLFYGDMRFRAPIEPLLVLIASDALCKLCVFMKEFISRWQHRSPLADTVSPIQ